jgi:hypothetical protein
MVRRRRSRRHGLLHEQLGRVLSRCRRSHAASDAESLRRSTGPAPRVSGNTDRVVSTALSIPTNRWTRPATTNSWRTTSRPRGRHSPTSPQSCSPTNTPTTSASSTSSAAPAPTSGYTNATPRSRTATRQRPPSRQIRTIPGALPASTTHRARPSRAPGPHRSRLLRVYGRRSRRVVPCPVTVPSWPSASLRTIARPSSLLPVARLRDFSERQNGRTRAAGPLPRYRYLCRPPRSPIRSERIRADRNRPVGRRVPYRVGDHLPQPHRVRPHHRWLRSDDHRCRHSAGHSGTSTGTQCRRSVPASSSVRSCRSSMTCCSTPASFSNDATTAASTVDTPQNRGESWLSRKQPAVSRPRL